MPVPIALLSVEHFQVYNVRDTYLRRLSVMGLAAMATQFRILMGKNALLGVRNFKGTVTQLATPIVVCLILWLFQLLSDAVLSRSTERS